MEGEMETAMRMEDDARGEDKKERRFFSAAASSSGLGASRHIRSKARQVRIVKVEGWRRVMLIPGRPKDALALLSIIRDLE
jgi:hypothetical protein